VPHKGQYQPKNVDGEKIRVDQTTLMQYLQRIIITQCKFQRQSGCDF